MSQATSSLGQRATALRALFTERIGLKLASLVVALLLWLVVRARQPTEGYVDVMVVPTLDSSLVLLGDPPRVRARVAGRTADLVKLYDTPPVITSAVGGDAPDTLMLDLVADDVHVPAEIADVVRVIDVQPQSVMLRFETRGTRRVAVVSDGRVLVRAAGGLVAPETVHFEPAFVRVSGARAAVRRVQSVRSMPVSLDAADTLVHVVDVDTAGLGLLVHPAQVKVRLVHESVP